MLMITPGEAREEANAAPMPLLAPVIRTDRYEVIFIQHLYTTLKSLTMDKRVPVLLVGFAVYG